MGFSMTVTQVEMACGECGITYSMPYALHEERKNDGKLFYCPNGHGRLFRRPELEQAKFELKQKTEELARVKASHESSEKWQRDRYERAERRLVYYRGWVTKLKKLVVGLRKRLEDK